jgi:proteasome activator subunit 4
MLTFLPLSHPQSYLPVLFRIWESVNSYMYDDRMLHFLSLLVEIHMDPSTSDPRKIEDVPDDAISMGEARPQWKQDDFHHSVGRWKGIFKDVGIFTESEWNLLMSKCLASMGESSYLVQHMKLILVSCRNCISGLGFSEHWSFRGQSSIV